MRTRAPLRLGLAGGGTDLSPFCDVHGGAALNVTIDRYAHVSLRLTGGSEVEMTATDLSRSECVPAGLLEPAGPLPLHRAVYNRIVKQFNAGQAFGASLTSMVDAAPGSGLGSSSALVVALVDAFREALRLPLDRYDVARLAFEIERIDLSLAGGRQDQYAASLGGLNFMEFLANDRVFVYPLRASRAVIDELEASLVICFTGQSRASEAIITEQIAAMGIEKSRALDGMHQLKADAFDMRAALLQGDIAEMARVLNRSWIAKKSTANNVSTPLIEDLLHVAHRNGAMAGKVSGAGGGGFMMFIVDPDERVRLLRALTKAGGVPANVNFSWNGVESCSV